MQPLSLLDECHARYGDVFSLRAPGGVKFVIVATPELIKQVVAADAAVLLAGVGNATLLEPMLGKHSLLTLDGKEHLRQRRLLLPAFHGERMHAFETVMREITEASFARWPVGQPFALHPFMQSITLDVILRTVFGFTHSHDHRELRARLVEILEVATNPWLLFPGMIGVDPFRVPWLRITKLKRALDESLYHLIAARRRSPSGTDVLAMMLEARDEQGKAMTDVEIRDELITLLLAGHETTATALAWTFDQLLANPQTFAKLQAELAAGSDGYLDCVIRETLRVRPIVPLIGRHVAKPFQLGTWTIPAGHRIAPSIYLAGRNRDAYPSPQRFEPERWIGVKPDPYTWLPFGGGVRRCIGMAFAQFEMRVVLQTVVARARMHLAERFGIGRPAAQPRNLGELWRREIELGRADADHLAAHAKARERRWRLGAARDQNQAAFRHLRERRLERGMQLAFRRHRMQIFEHQCERRLRSRKQRAKEAARAPARRRLARCGCALPGARILELARGMAEVMKERRDIRVVGIELIPEAAQTARLDIARGERGLSRAGRSRDPGDGAAGCVDPGEQPLARHQRSDRGARGLGEGDGALAAFNGQRVLRNWRVPPRPTLRSLDLAGPARSHRAPPARRADRPRSKRPSSPAAGSDSRTPSPCYGR